MGHINVRTNNNDYPFVEKVYISYDKKSYISLNTGEVIYYEDDILKKYQFNMGKNAYKMLVFLIENNNTFVTSDTIYYDILGGEISDNKDKVVDETRKTLWAIPCIRRSDLKIKKHTLGETSFPGYTLILPDQRIIKPLEKFLAHQLRYFYFDSEMIEDLYSLAGGESLDYDKNPRNEMISQLEKLAYNEGNDIELELLENISSTELVSIKEIFLLSGLYVYGRRWEDNRNPIDLLNYNPETITLAFESVNTDISVRMMLSGKKMYYALRHMLLYINGTDRMFKLRILGFVNHINKGTDYMIKPIRILCID